MPPVHRKINRREFLKLGSIGLTGLALPKHLSVLGESPISRVGRVTSESLSVYQEASDKSKILFQHFRDDILNIYQDVISKDGPGYNPLWHRVWGGYVHSAWVQRVRNQLNPILRNFPSSGQLMELSVPYSQSYRIRQNGTWEPFYRLYYSSTHWAFEVVEGPDGEAWYKVNNSLLMLSYYVRAIHMRKVEPDELLPINPEIDPKSKRIEISIDFQRLRAYEGDNLVKEFLVSTGLPTILKGKGIIPTDSPKGDHIIESKRPSVHMGDGTLRSDAEAYELPGVPWVSYFEPTTGVAIHGTYWHNNFGVTMSHGCINMRSEDAKWIFRWSTPTPQETNENAVFHTPVTVI
jgi:lipoprotein-anchoring transpeptidase ErfK/SrfK